MATIYDRESPHSALPQLEKKIDEIQNVIISRAFPVGTMYYTSDEKFDPNRAWGGTWELTGSNPFEWHRTR